MKMFLPASALFALGAASFASADIGVVEATGAFQLAGASSTSYVSAIGADGNPRLDGYDFGSVNALTGQSLLLQNWYFENYAYNGGSTPPGALTNDNWLDGNNVAALVVTIKSGASVVSSTNYSLYQTSNSGNNRFWQLALASQNANLTVSGYLNGFSLFASQLGGGTDNRQPYFNNFAIDAVPGPGALALLGLAGIVGARRRR